MTVIIVEGESDRVAVRVLAERLGLGAPEVRAVGGSKGARRAAEALKGERLIGLVDRPERADFERWIPEVYACDPDLEGELVRAVGVDAVLALIERAGEGESFRRLQHQPAQRSRTVEQQLARFFAGRSGNKLRYAGILADAVDLARVPTPIRALLDAASAATEGEMSEPGGRQGA